MGRGGVKLASYKGGPDPSSIPKWALVRSNWGPTGVQLGPIWNAAWEVCMLMARKMSPCRIKDRETA